MCVYKMYIYMCLYEISYAPQVLKSMNYLGVSVGVHGANGNVRRIYREYDDTVKSWKNVLEVGQMLRNFSLYANISCDLQLTHDSDVIPSSYRMKSGQIDCFHNSLLRLT